MCLSCELNLWLKRVSRSVFYNQQSIFKNWCTSSRYIGCPRFQFAHMIVKTQLSLLHLRLLVSIHLRNLFFSLPLNFLFSCWLLLCLSVCHVLGWHTFIVDILLLPTCTFNFSSECFGRHWLLFLFSHLKFNTPLLLVARWRGRGRALWRHSDRIHVKTCGSEAAWSDLGAWMLGLSEWAEFILRCRNMKSSSYTL